MVATTFATMAVERIADGASGRMMAIQKGCFVDADIPEAGSRPRSVDLETMYNTERYRPNYANKSGLPIFLTELD